MGRRSPTGRKMHISVLMSAERHTALLVQATKNSNRVPNEDNMPPSRDPRYLIPSRPAASKEVMESILRPTKHPRYFLGATEQESVDPWPGDLYDMEQLEREAASVPLSYSAPDWILCLAPSVKHVPCYIPHRLIRHFADTEIILDPDSAPMSPPNLGLTPADFINAGLCGAARTPGTSAYLCQVGYGAFPPVNTDDPGPMYISNPGNHTNPVRGKKSPFRYPESADVWMGFTRDIYHSRPPRPGF
ncbi:hypothetical protein QBC34DRAFT_395335 [Podospora aff. communis PSN243]|uniref:Uncharacterized protein n=1 Tax=Podospora aff. communis PSN243 TaxID=3040156 RepID=A0AAV9GXB8_9PEZI|nr:hypothetical protein QBC34DRAFT_395335 [Podospora aff. communis PSN243]